MPLSRLVPAALAALLAGTVLAAFTPEAAADPACVSTSSCTGSGYTVCVAVSSCPSGGYVCAAQWSCGTSAFCVARGGCGPGGGTACVADGGWCDGSETVCVAYHCGSATVCVGPSGTWMSCWGSQVCVTWAEAHCGAVCVSLNSASCSTVAVSLLGDASGPGVTLDAQTALDRVFPLIAGTTYSTYPFEPYVTACVTGICHQARLVVLEAKPCLDGACTTAGGAVATALDAVGGSVGTVTSLVCVSATSCTSSLVCVGLERCGCWMDPSTWGCHGSVVCVTLDACEGDARYCAVACVTSQVCVSAVACEGGETFEVCVAPESCGPNAVCVSADCGASFACIGLACDSAGLACVSLACGASYSYVDPDPEDGVVRAGAIGYNGMVEPAATRACLNAACHDEATLVALTLDTDSDGYSNADEASGNSDPTNSASTPWTDDDCDGRPNRAEPDLLAAQGVAHPALKVSGGGVTFDPTTFATTVTPPTVAIVPEGASSC